MTAALLLTLTAGTGPRPGVALFRAPQQIDSFVRMDSRLAAIARQPQFTWLDENDRPEHVRSLVRAAAGRLLPLVLYAIPQRDAVAGYSAGGVRSVAEYHRWIVHTARTLDAAPALVVVEPDAVGQAATLGATAGRERLQAVRDTVEVLKAEAPNSQVYVDASMWIPTAEMASLLRSAGVGKADGFSLNVSNYRPDEEVFRYGNRLSESLEGKHYIVDTSRNGLGVGADRHAWCNVRGRALGSLPGTAPRNQPMVDGLFWIKHPGVSDGTCNGGPPAGQVWLEVAVELVVNARLSRGRV